MIDIKDMVFMIGRGEIKTVEDAEPLIIKSYGKKKADRAIKYAKGKMKAQRTTDVSQFLAFVDTALNGAPKEDEDFSPDDM